MTDPLLLFPAWTGWVALASQTAVAAVAGGLAVWTANAIAAAPLRRAAQPHWVERARLAHPGRVARLFALVFTPALAAGVGRLYAGPLSVAPAALHSAAGALAAFLAALLVHLRLSRRNGRPDSSLRAWLRDFAASVLGLYLHVVGALVIGLLAPAGVGRRTLWFVVAAVVLAGFVFRGGGLVLARAVRLASPARERLRRVVAGVADRTGIRPRGVDELAWRSANAFAFPGAGRLVFTRGALDLLDDEELAAVAAHELAHLAESERVRAVRFGATLALVVALVLTPPLGAAYGIGAVLSVAVFLLVLLRVVRTLLRRLESEADAAGRAGEGTSGTYARALASIYRANAFPAVTSRRGASHPPLYDRMLAAGVEPDFPRPAPPSSRRALAGMAAAFLVGTVLIAGVRVGLSAAPLLLAPGAAEGGSTALLLSAAGGGRAVDIARLGRGREAGGDIDGALALYAAAMDVDAGFVWPARSRAWLLVMDGRCDEAEAAALEYLRRASLVSRPGEPEWEEGVRPVLDATVECRGAPAPSAPGGTWNAEE